MRKEEQMLLQMQAAMENMAKAIQHFTAVVEELEVTASNALEDNLREPTCPVCKDTGFLNEEGIISARPCNHCEHYKALKGMKQRIDR